MNNANSLTLQDFAKFARPRPGTHIVFSICFEILFWILLLFFTLGFLVEDTFRAFVILFLWTIDVPVSEDAIDNPLSLLGFEMILLYVLIALFGRLRKRFRINTVMRLQNETRAPILYLRSFYLESFEQGREENLKYYEKEHDDEVLAVALKDIGPLIAVGKPGDTFPPLGSLRLYFKDQEWKEQVKNLMEISQLIVIQPGYTTGTEWEMLELKSFPPEKIIYSFLAWQHWDETFWRAEYGTFAEQFRRIYGQDLPDNVGYDQFLYFDKEWRPHLTKLPLWKSYFFWFCSAPHLIWRLWSILLKRLSLLFDLLYPAFKRLPVPKLLRKYSVASVRESLRPMFRERNRRLPVWRTVVYAVAVVIGVGWLSLISAAYLITVWMNR